MIQETVYTAMCGCGAKLQTVCNAVARPSAVVCTCGKTYDSITVQMEFESYVVNRAFTSLPRHRQIKQPMSAAKIRKYKSLEEAERRRAARLTGDDEE